MSAALPRDWRGKRGSCLRGNPECGGTRCCLSRPARTALLLRQSPLIPSLCSLPPASCHLPMSLFDARYRHLKGTMSAWHMRLYICLQFWRWVLLLIHMPRLVGAAIRMCLTLPSHPAPQCKTCWQWDVLSCQVVVLCEWLNAVLHGFGVTLKPFPCPSVFLSPMPLHLPSRPIFCFFPLSSFYLFLSSSSLHILTHYSLCLFLSFPSACILRFASSPLSVCLLLREKSDLQAVCLKPFTVGLQRWSTVRKDCKSLCLG